MEKLIFFIIGLTLGEVTTLIIMSFLQVKRINEYEKKLKGDDIEKEKHKKAGMVKPKRRKKIKG